MHIVLFGLTISSSWGNGHATLWRSLVKAMLRRGHTVSFYERDVPYYASERDLETLPQGGRLVLYHSLDEIAQVARRDCDQADLALYTSYCPEGARIAELLLSTRATIKGFYDLDTPVTLDALDTRGTVDYLPADGLGAFDLVLSYTGGRALDELHTRLGARLAVPLYGSVDPENHRPVTPQKQYAATLSYLGTYAADRQQALCRLFIEAAERLPREHFLIGGAQYPQDFPWRDNIFFRRHVAPSEHPAFFSSSRATLNVTRAAMARYGFCPSGRLFEAAACGVTQLTDTWEGLDTFFKLGRELIAVQTTDDVVAALQRPEEELRAIAQAARRRVLAEHTGDNRVAELERICSVVKDSLRHSDPEAALNLREVAHA